MPNRGCTKPDTVLHCFRIDAASVLWWYCNVMQQHDIVLVQSLEASSHLRTCGIQRLFWDLCVLRIWLYKMYNSLICLKTAKETCFRLFHHPVLKYLLCLPILLGKGGFSAQMTVVRALRSAEVALPLEGDNLPR